MIQEFINLHDAIQLKELGFDEPCLWFYDNNGDDGFVEFLANENGCKNSEYKEIITAPLYQQVFKFFRDKYNIDSEIYMNHEFGIKFYSYLLLELKDSVITHLSGASGRFETHENAQLECVKKIIELITIKNKNNE